MNRPSVCVSILYWHSFEDTIDCVRSVLDSEYDEVHVVLSNNSRYSPERVVGRFDADRVSVIDHRDNVGFARGHNRAADVAREQGDEYIFFLNNDAILDEASIGRLVDRAETADAPGLYAPKVYRRNGRERLEFIAGYIDWTVGTPHSYGSELESDAREVPRPLEQSDIDYLHGAALFAPLDAFRSLNGFDESYFIFYEDTDLGQRAKERGIRLEPVENAVVYHQKDDDINIQEYEDFWAYLNTRNKFWFMARHATGKQFAWFLCWYFLYIVPRRFADGIVNQKGLTFVLFTLYGCLAAVTFTPFRESHIRERTDKAVANYVETDEV